MAAAIKAELAAANVGDEDLVIKWGDKGETTKTGIHTNLTTKNTDRKKEAGHSGDFKKMQKRKIQPTCMN